MGYGWKIKDLYSCRNKLVELAKRARKEDDFNYIATILQNLNEIIGDIKNNGREPRVSYDERLGNIDKELKTFGIYYDLIDDFVMKIAGFEEQLTRIEEIFKPFIADNESYAKFTGETLSNARAFALTKRFFQRFDSEWYPIFLRAFGERYSSVAFVGELRDYNMADSFYIDLIDRYFIEMVKTKDVSKLFTLVHEYGHVLSYIVNPKRYILCKNDMYDEVPAVFPEMLAMYMNIGEFNETHIAFEKHSSLVSVYNLANNLVMHLPYVDIWKDKGKKANRKFMKAVKMEFDEDKEQIEDSLDTYINTCGTYIMAYMVSIELMNIYRRDKKKALDIYHGLIQVPYMEDTHDYITSELILGKSLEEETSLMLDDFEKKLKKGGTFHV